MDEKMLDALETLAQAAMSAAEKEPCEYSQGLAMGIVIAFSTALAISMGHDPEDGMRALALIHERNKEVE